jgi:hypothetical protein
MGNIIVQILHLATHCASIPLRQAREYTMLDVAGSPAKSLRFNDQHDFQAFRVRLYDRRRLVKMMTSRAHTEYVAAGIQPAYTTSLTAFGISAGRSSPQMATAVLIHIHLPDLQALKVRNAVNKIRTSTFKI